MLTRLMTKLNDGLSYLNHFKRKQTINAIDMTLFFRQFATLIAAGIPLIKSCDILEKSQEKILLQQLISSLKRELLAGKNLFHGLQQHPRYFDELTCQLVHLGEHTGKLDAMLVAVATYQEKNLAFKKRIKQALFYPCLIMLTACVVTLSLFIFVIPHFAELFQDSQVTLPALTRFIFSISIQLQKHLWPVFCSVFLSFFLLFRTHYVSFLKYHLQQLLSPLPMIQPYLRKMILARFVRNLAITIAAGMPLIDALKLTAKSCGNIAFSNLIANLRSKIYAGQGLHHAMASFSYFPTMMIQMIKIGEESGTLEFMLDKVADFFESDIDQFMSQLSQLLEPLIMVVLGVLIGGLVIGMYLPIFKLGNTL